MSPDQDLGPWAKALETLLTDRRVYERCAEDSRAAALDYVAPITVDAFAQFLEHLGVSSPV